MQDNTSKQGITSIFYELYFNDKGQVGFFKNPHAKHDRRTKSIEYKGLKEHEGRKKHTYKIEYGLCNDTFVSNRECNHPVVSKEDGRNICEGCGLVSGPKKLIADYDILVQRGIIQENESEIVRYNEPKHELTQSGEYIKRLMDNDYYYNMITKKQPELTDDGRIKYIDNAEEEWRSAQKAMYVDIVSSHYMMTGYQKQRVKEFIDNHSLKKVHSRINSNAIITGICIYFMKKDERHILIKNSKFCKEVGLNNNNYRVIELNMSRLMF